MKATDPDVPINWVAALGSGARCDPHNVTHRDGFRAPLTAHDGWATVLARNADFSLHAHTPLVLLSTVTWGFERLDLARSGSANEQRVVTRQRCFPTTTVDPDGDCSNQKVDGSSNPVISGGDGAVFEPSRTLRGRERIAVTDRLLTSVPGGRSRGAE